jgi:alkylhydroperoxidase family enzyme
MQARIKNPAMVLPGAVELLRSLAKTSEQGGVPKKTLDLVHLRASQINGCSVCVDLSFRFKQPDETIERLFAALHGTTRPTSRTPNAPRWHSPKPSLD